MHMNEQGHQTGVGALIYYALDSLCWPHQPHQGVIN